MPLLLYSYAHRPHLPSFPTRRSSDLRERNERVALTRDQIDAPRQQEQRPRMRTRLPPEARGNQRRQHPREARARSEEHTSELQSPCNLVCRLLLEKKTRRRRASTWVR